MGCGCWRLLSWLFHHCIFVFLFLFLAGRWSGFVNLDDCFWRLCLHVCVVHRATQSVQCVFVSILGQVVRARQGMSLSVSASLGVLLTGFLLFRTCCCLNCWEARIRSTPTASSPLWLLSWYTSFSCRIDALVWSPPSNSFTTTFRSPSLQGVADANITLLASTTSSSVTLQSGVSVYRRARESALFSSLPPL